ncbi:hypothetical protein ACTJKC_15295 [Pedobacter sp. 22226]|uniref:hypothetical protein n=1 Tax=Pedobacter sp. 22226 TaxID=3453894 RepID=UPI003F829D7C
MKIYHYFLAALPLMQLAACKRDQTREFLPGTYTNSARGKYSQADDTLIVEATESNQFLIHRRTGFNIIDGGKIGKRQYESEEWNAVYDEGTRTLTETRKGRLINIFPGSGYILIGKRKYTKN